MSDEEKREDVDADGASQEEVAPERRLHLSAPAELRALRNWVVWRYEPGATGNPTKVPYIAADGEVKASTTAPSTWRTFDEALDAAPRFDGVGFVLPLEPQITGVDLDNAIDEDGSIRPWARKIIRTLNSYTEVTPSGRGLRVLLWGVLREGAQHKHYFVDRHEEHPQAVELYTVARYFTVTGEHLAGTSTTLRQRQDELALVQKWLLLRRKPQRETPQQERQPSEVDDISDEELIANALQAKNGAKFQELWEGDGSDYPSPSEAWMALLCHLAFWTDRNASRMERLARRSGLYEANPKKHERLMEHEIAEAIKCTPNGWKPTAQDAPPRGLYLVEGGQICRTKKTKDGDYTLPLSNFDARIIEEVTRDDGAERTLIFRVDGRLYNGTPLGLATVPASSFPGMTWPVESWGSRAVVSAGAKDHLRAALQTLSNPHRKTVYGHAGWRNVGGLWLYLTSSGGLGADGLHRDVTVELSGGLASTCLPESGTVDDVRASLRLLQVAPAEVTHVLLAGTYRAPLGEVVPLDLSLFIVGHTGSLKTELTAIMQAHYGAGYHGKNLPAGWSSTANALEAMAFFAKDMVFVVDDFAPRGGQREVDRLHREAERLFRAVGNRAGRGRMRSDGSLRPTYFPRGLVVSSGEDIPRGESVRARMDVLELQREHVDLGVLTELQRAAANGALARSMAAYVRWLAPQLDELSSALSVRRLELRHNWQQLLPDSHKRSADNLASLYLGLETFAQFAVALGAITDEQKDKLVGDGQSALLSTGSAQVQHLRSEDPVERFFHVLAAAVNSGAAHMVDCVTGAAPDRPGAWGWRCWETSASGDEWRPQGSCVGWVDGDALFLDPDAAFAVVQTMAQRQGTALSVSAQTLWKRLDERGLLLSTDVGRHSVKKTVAGKRTRVVHVSAAKVVELAGSATSEE